MYHVLVRGYSGMVLPDTVVLDHLLQPSVQALRAQPLKFLNLQLLFSLGKKTQNTHTCKDSHSTSQNRSEPVPVLERRLNKLGARP